MNYRELFPQVDDRTAATLLVTGLPCQFMWNWAGIGTKVVVIA